MELHGVELLDHSPEFTPGARCPHCGNAEFRGICTGDTYQRFEPPADDELAEYGEDTGPDLGDYHTVLCGECDGLVWYDDAHFVSDTVIDQVIACAPETGRGGLALALNPWRLSALDGWVSTARAELERLDGTSEGWS